MVSSRAADSLGVRSPVALTGTPGSGKTAVARLLPARWTTLEVAALARLTRSGRHRGGSLSVDLALLRKRSRQSAEFRSADVVVGHLAHFLPIRDVIVLRCHPIELGRRLRHARRGTPEDRAANVVAEATDLILMEALRLRRRIWEVDTTHRRPSAIASEVDRLLRRRAVPSYGGIDWLADRSVTEHL
ncbi:MAG: AAA family ATPase [Thermoplasmata archaeon]